MYNIIYDIIAILEIQDLTGISRGWPGLFVGNALCKHLHTIG